LRDLEGLLVLRASQSIEKSVQLGYRGDIRDEDP